MFRYHPAYRLAAFLLCAFLVAQVPFIVWIIFERDLTGQGQERASQLVSEAQRIASDRKALAATEKKLKRIQDLAPLCGPGCRSGRSSAKSSSSPRLISPLPG